MWNAHKQLRVWLHGLMTRGRGRPRTRVCVCGVGGLGRFLLPAICLLSFSKSPPTTSCGSLQHHHLPFLALYFYTFFFILITAPSSTEVMTLPQHVFLRFPIRLTRLPPAYCLAPPGPFNEVLKRFPWADLTSWPSLSVAGHRCWSDWNRELLADIWLWTICL